MCWAGESAPEMVGYDSISFSCEFEPYGAGRDFDRQFLPGSLAEYPLC